MTEPDLLLQSLIIALDTPAQFGDVHQFAEADIFGSVDKLVLGGFLFAFGLILTNSHLPAEEVGEGVVSMRGANAHAGEARRQPLAVALAPRDLAPGAPGQAESAFFDEHRLMPIVATEAPSSRRPRPDHVFGDGGSVSHVDTVVFGKISTT